MSRPHSRLIAVPFPLRLPPSRVASRASALSDPLRPSAKVTLRQHREGMRMRRRAQSGAGRRPRPGGAAVQPGRGRGLVVARQDGQCATRFQHWRGAGHHKSGSTTYLHQVYVNQYPGGHHANDAAHGPREAIMYQRRTRVWCHLGSPRPRQQHHAAWFRLGHRRQRRACLRGVGASRQVRLRVGHTTHAPVPGQRPQRQRFVGCRQGPGR